MTRIGHFCIYHVVKVAIFIMSVYRCHFHSVCNPYLRVFLRQKQNPRFSTQSEEESIFVIQSNFPEEKSMHFKEKWRIIEVLII